MWTILVKACQLKNKVFVIWSCAPFPFNIFISHVGTQLQITCIKCMLENTTLIIACHLLLSWHSSLQTKKIKIKKHKHKGNQNHFQKIQNNTNTVIQLVRIINQSTHLHHWYYQLCNDIYHLETIFNKYCFQIASYILPVNKFMWIKLHLMQLYIFFLIRRQQRTWFKHSVSLENYAFFLDLPS